MLAGPRFPDEADLELAALGSGLDRAGLLARLAGSGSRPVSTTTHQLLPRLLITWSPVWGTRMIMEVREASGEEAL